ncbi:hypothetical protein [Goodfellowiella coeruleoviolacea]|uniref:Uncharacterized protein n=1 Tax=Goodfellowiella coeruleoviolacea TaxID=334858 RepID=A0AAE3GB39_9PSEU|nr:hypothetical protein [Goodfellowiella coeruleoviolacea]MCP2163799.1 hypothetical protein [Goodfellowiella coeruleoviolacea]
MRSVVAWIGTGSGAAGLLLVVVGTFLPWLRSGSVLRDSYQAIGSVRGLTNLNAGVGALLTAWIGIAPFAVLCVVLFTLGLRRTAAGLVVLFGTITGTTAGVAAVQGGDEGALIGITVAGPVVTLCGAVLAVVGAVAVLTATTRSAGRNPGGAQQ